MRAIVTRAVSKREANNFLGRAVSEGEQFYVFEGPTFGSCDTNNGIALSERGASEYPFFEFPRNAIRQVQS